MGGNFREKIIKYTSSMVYVEEIGAFPESGSIVRNSIDMKLSDEGVWSEGVDNI